METQTAHARYSSQLLALQLCKHQHVSGVSSEGTAASRHPELQSVMSVSRRRGPPSPVSSVQLIPSRVVPEELFITLAHGKSPLTFLHRPWDKGTLWVASNTHQNYGMQEFGAEC